jgi:lipopolysaccharide export system protein LptA
MRTALLVILTLLVLCGGVWFFVLRGREATPEQLRLLAERNTRRDVTTSVITRPVAGADGTGFAGEGAWAQTLDVTGQRIVSEFRAQRYEPKPDGPIDVIKPEARFYLKDGRVILLVAETGRVTMSGGGPSMDMQSMQSQTPSRGEMRKVTIRITDAPDAPPQRDVMTVTVDHLVFDNTTYRIETTDAVIDGQRVPADQIPVVVRGRDFEFDGTGLIAVWSDVGDRIDLLEITHGQRLLVKNPAQVMPGNATALRAEPRLALPDRSAIALALFGQVAATEEPSIDAAELRQRTRDYVAEFEQNVRATQSGVEIAAGDLLRATFQLDPEVKPTDTPKKKRRNAATKPATAPTTAPAPIEIRWSGRLRVTPALASRAATAPATSPAVPQRYAELIGRPAVVRRDGNTVRAASILIEPDTRRVRLSPGERANDTVELTQTDGTRIVARAIDADPSEGNAVVTGPGLMQSPGSVDGTRKPLDVSFKNQARLTSVTIDGRDLPRMLVVDGDVALKQDRLSLSSQLLVLDFDAAHARPSTSTTGLDFDLRSLRAISAKDNVHVTGLGKSPDATMHAGELVLVVTDTPVGAAVTGIRCADGVKLIDAGQSFSALTLDATLKPILLDGNATNAAADNTDPLDAIVEMTAEGSVLLDRGARGTSRADRMTITENENGKRIIAMFGAPAIASSERGNLASTKIELEPTTGELRVPQAGTFDGTETLSDGTRRDVSMSWDGYLMASARDGVATLSQKVKINSRESTGATMNASAGRAVVRFVAAPATQPAGDANDPMRAFRVESLETVELIEDVRVDADGGDKRRAVIEAPIVHFDDLSKDITIDRAGRMMVSDLRPRHPAAAKPGEKQSAMSRGTLAIKWDKALRWNARDGTLIADEGVRLGFERATDAGTPDDIGPVRLDADRMVGKLLATDTNANADKTLMDGLQLQSMQFAGTVRVRSKKLSFDAASIDYDAATGIATATSAGNRRVEVYADDGVSKVTIDSLRWNVVTGLPEEFIGIDGRIRR